MIIERKYFPDILPDNEETYFSMLAGVIESVDELCTVQISKLNEHYHFRIAPSLPKYNDFLIKEITGFHNIFGIHVDFSKSIKTSAILSFKISTI